MRIAVVSQEYPPETAHGGIASQTYLKAHGLARLGHEIVVVSHSTDDRRQECRDGPVAVVRLPAADARLEVRSEPARWITWSTQVATVLAELHAQAPLDLVDLPEYGGEGYVHLLNQAEWGRIPTIVQLHGPLGMLSEHLGWPQPDSDLFRLGALMEETCLRLADGVYSSSAYTRDWCVAHYGLTPRTPVLHLGVDTTLFSPGTAVGEGEDWRGEGGRPTILFVGRVAPSKGVEVLLDAALRVAASWPGLRLRLVGRGEPGLLGSLAARARAAGFPRLLELPGAVSRASLSEEYRAADVFAAPSFFEGGPGLVYLEAMACGLPVVAGGGSGVDQVVVDGSAGLLVPPGDVDAVAFALERLLGDQRWRRDMGRRAREWVACEADTTVCVRRLERLYADVLLGRVAVGDGGP